MRHLEKPKRIVATSKYYGGKWFLAPKIAPYVRGGKIYVEPYCGMANVFWVKEPHPVEVLNDKDEEIVNVFRCLQDWNTFKVLAHRLAWTPYSLAELRRAVRILEGESQDAVDRAWARIVAGNFSVNGVAFSSWSRAVGKIANGMAGRCAAWRTHISLLRFWHDRLTRVQIDCRDALEVIRYWDSPDTVFYLDPPYPPSTRRKGSEDNKYRHEMSEEDHQRMVETILHCKGRVVLSGYATPLYKPLEDAGWHVIQMPIQCMTRCRPRSDKKHLVKQTADLQRVEQLWINRLPNGEASLLDLCGGHAE